MKLGFTPEQDKFRQEVRRFVRDNLPEETRRRGYTGQPFKKDDYFAWQRCLAEKGWCAPSWPREYGGAGWGPVDRFIFEEEVAVGCAPRVNAPGFDLLGPVIIKYGTEAQKSYFLPRMLAGAHWWCQGFSEPGAGSDLAALKCKAVLEGDRYVVNGSKIWTSHAHYSNWIFCLVRTSTEGRKQAGISFLLIAMDTPGLSVRPIITLGAVHAVNEVFFKDVLVPRGNLIGSEGQGWEITKFLLGAERVIGIALGLSWKMLFQLKRLGRQTLRAGAPAWGDALFRAQVASLEVDLTAIQHSAYRVLAEEEAGKPIGPDVSVIKLRGAEVQQKLSEALMDLAGPLALVAPQSLSAGDPLQALAQIHFATQYLDRRKVSIYGGASEIQRNIIAHRILGL